MKGAHYVRVLEKTETIDGVKWRLLPKSVTADPDGRHWVPERRVTEARKVVAAGLGDEPLYRINFEEVARFVGIGTVEEWRDSLVYDSVLIQVWPEEEL